MAEKGSGPGRAPTKSPDKREIARDLFQDHLDLDRMARAVLGAQRPTVAEPHHAEADNRSSVQEQAASPTKAEQANVSPGESVGENATFSSVLDRMRSASGKQGAAILKDKTVALRSRNNPQAVPAPVFQHAASLELTRPSPPRRFGRQTILAASFAGLMLCLVATGLGNSDGGTDRTPASAERVASASNLTKASRILAPSQVPIFRSQTGPTATSRQTPDGSADRGVKPSTPASSVLAFQEVPPAVSLVAELVPPAPEQVTAVPFRARFGADSGNDWLLAPRLALNSSTPEPLPVAAARIEDRSAPIVYTSAAMPMTPPSQDMMRDEPVEPTERQARIRSVASLPSPPDRTDAPVIRSETAASPLILVTSLRPLPRPTNLEETSIAVPPPQTAAASGPARLVVHYPPAVSRQRAEALASQLRQQGIGGVELRAVDIAVARSDVRYFFGNDKGAALNAVAVLSGQDRPATIRDLSDYRPLPRQGTVEIWLSN